MAEARAGASVGMLRQFHGLGRKFAVFGACLAIAFSWHGETGLVFAAESSPAPGSPERKLNKDSTYVHLQPEWKSYPGNIVFDITTVWDRTSLNVMRDANSGDANAYMQQTRERGTRTVRQQHGKKFIEVRVDSNCQDIWVHYARPVVDGLRHQFEFMLGKQQSADPESVMVAHVPNPNYGETDQETKLATGYAQFIPICTSKETTSYDYGVTINDESVGFDIYFVPSIDERDKLVQRRSSFSPYDGCAGHNYQSFSGTCENVGRDSGLLIVIPDELQRALTHVTVKLRER